MIVVAHSGGLDSTVLLHMARATRRKVHALCFAYGQPAQREEISASLRICEAERFAWHELRVTVFGSHMHTGAGAKGARVLPGRNAVLLSHAINYAAHIGAESVWFGAIADDTEYPDRSPGFIGAMQEVATAAGIVLLAPLLTMTKPSVMDLARTHGVDVAATWSCYEPAAPFVPCETCNACTSRREALEVTK